MNQLPLLNMNIDFPVSSIESKFDTPGPGSYNIDGQFSKLSDRQLSTHLTKR
jgi:hypothetical protein